MEEHFTMFWNNPNIKGITLWGYVHGATWVPDSGLIREDGSFRPAMTWLTDFLSRK
jgi:endo-1,4-beta-xylanase